MPRVKTMSRHEAIGARLRPRRIGPWLKQAERNRHEVRDVRKTWTADRGP